MKSKDKIDVTVKARWGKQWMFIRHKQQAEEWMPSFEDWWRMIQALKHCEREKYPNLPDPLAMPRAFFVRCFDDVDWDTVKREFNIPTRE